MKYENPAVIELLQTYLDFAKKDGSWDNVAISMVRHPGEAASDFAGDIALQISQAEGLGLLQVKLKNAIDNWMLPPSDPTLDVSHVVYNVANGPLGFDFLIWLIDAEMTRIRAGAPAPLKVAFWTGKNGRATFEQQMWLDNVFRPILGLMGVVEFKGAMVGQNKPLFTPRDIVSAVKAGEKVPKLQALLWAIKIVKSHFPRSPITITLREAAHDTLRNSNILAWIGFADYLKKQGESVIFVRDTSCANLPLPHDHQICPTASTDLNIRMALYEHAKMNFFVSNGPGGLAIFSERPWMQFIAPEKERFNSSESWREYGVEIGQQWPWSRLDQRLVWCEDSFENIMQAWNSFELAEAA